MKETKYPIDNQIRKLWRNDSTICATEYNIFREEFVNTGEF
jgi:hypothetical protein